MAALVPLAPLALGCWGDERVSAVCCDVFPPRHEVGNLCFMRGESDYGPAFCCGSGRFHELAPGYFEPHVLGRSLLPRTCNETTVDLRLFVQSLSRRDHPDLGVFSLVAIVTEVRIFLWNSVVTASLRLLLRTLDVVWPFALRACAPAAWLGLLMRAEELVYLDPVAAQALLDIAAVAWATAPTPGPLQAPVGLPSDAWELVRELHVRVAAMTASAQRGAFDVGAVDVVIFACSASDDDLAHLRRLQPADLPVGPPGGGSRLFVYDLCRPFGPYHRRFQPFVVLPVLPAEENVVGAAAAHLSSGFSASHVLSFDEEVPTAGTGAALAHLAAHYGDLSDLTVFLHADFVEHVLPPLRGRLVAALARGLWPPELDFLYLSWYTLPPTADGRVGSAKKCYCDSREVAARVCPQEAGELSCLFLGRLWKMLFGRPLRAEDDFGGYANSQFVVSRHAAQRRGRPFLQHAARTLGSLSLWAPSSKSAVGAVGRAKTMAPAILVASSGSDRPRNGSMAARQAARHWPAYAWMETLWHVLFLPLEDVAQPALLRSHDPAVPYFLEDYIWMAPPSQR